MAQNHHTSPNARLLGPDQPAQPRHGRGRFGGALSLSLAAHAAAALLAILALSRAGGPVDTAPGPAPLPDRIVWIAQDGRGGGGGGGGNRHPDPPQVAQAPGPDRMTVPVAPAPQQAPEVRETPSRPVELDIPAVATAAGVENLSGILDTTPFTSVSLGSGTETGAGTGTRGGIGGGDGDGLNHGTDRGTGDGAYEPGDGVSMPRLIHETKPAYTNEAMRAKVQGTVLLHGIVTPDGSLSAVRITSSLDPNFGLDREALRTVREWRFLPGRTRDGKPVPVRVAIEMAFTLR